MTVLFVAEIGKKRVIFHQIAWLHYINDELTMTNAVQSSARFLRVCSVGRSLIAGVCKSHRRRATAAELSKQTRDCHVTLG